MSPNQRRFPTAKHEVDNTFELERLNGCLFIVTSFVVTCRSLTKEHYFRSMGNDASTEIRHSNDKRVLYKVNNNMSPSSDNPVVASFDSEHLTIGAGVAIFHVASSRVVLCYHSVHKYWFLPKGRRDANEETGAAAEREGFEEVCTTIGTSTHQLTCTDKTSLGTGTV